MTTLARHDGRRAAEDEGREIAPYAGEPTEVRPSALAAVTRAEIDGQIAMAKQYPRSAERFLREARALVSLNPEVAASCTYRLPPRAGSPQAITGPSVRLAEIVACAWTNLRVIGRIVDDDGATVTAQGMCLDLERNVGYSVEVRRGVTTREGRRYSEHMVNTTCNAATAIATRNAVFKAVPRALVEIIESEARAVARGDLKTLPERTERALAFFASKGVAEEVVYRTLGILGRADVTLDHLVTLSGYRTAIQDGQATVQDIFAPAFGVDPRSVLQHGESRTAGLTRRLTTPPGDPAGDAAPPPDDKEPSFTPGTAGRITSEAEPEPTTDPPAAAPPVEPPPRKGGRRPPVGAPEVLPLEPGSNG